MHKQTRQQLNEYRQLIAQANGLDFNDTEKKFTVEPSVQQRLEQKTQDSSAFLKLINIIPVTEQRGEVLGLGIAGTLASTTDTTTAERTTQDLTSLESNSYQCEQINYDSHLKYSQLDLWAKFPDFKNKLTTLKTKRIALDRIMIGFNGTSHAKTSDRSKNQLLQDVQIGWLQQIRNNAPHRHMKEEQKNSGKIEIGEGKTFKNLDALVYSAVNDLIEPWFQEDTELVAIVGRDLMADKYFPLINATTNTPSEQLSADTIISQKRIGGLQAVRVPFMPSGTILITRLDNLSIYYQEGGMRRTFVDNVKKDQYEDYLSSNDAFVVENFDACALIENIKLADDQTTATVATA